MPIEEQKIPKVKGVTDIVFCIDSTGSMQPCIDGVKANVGAFADTIKNYSPNTHIDWRAKVIGYRDFDKDSDYLIDKFGFVSSGEELKSQLSELNAEGGDDEPESTLDVIAYAMLKSEWRTNVHKVVVVFSDASPHPNFSPKTIQDLGITDSLDVINQLIQEKRIKLFLFAPQNPIYEEISKYPRVTSSLFENAEEGLKNVDFKGILETIAKTVSMDMTSGNVL